MTTDADAEMREAIRRTLADLEIDGDYDGHVAGEILAELRRRGAWLPATTAEFAGPRCHATLNGDGTLTVAFAVDGTAVTTTLERIGK